MVLPAFQTRQSKRKSTIRPLLCIARVAATCPKIILIEWQWRQVFLTDQNRFSLFYADGPCGGTFCLRVPCIEGSRFCGKESHTQLNYHCVQYRSFEPLDIVMRSFFPTFSIYSSKTTKLNIFKSFSNLISKEKSKFLPNANIMLDFKIYRAFHFPCSVHIIL